MQPTYKPSMHMGKPMRANIILGIVLLILSGVLLFDRAPLVNAQQGLELACPANTSVLQNGTMLDTVTGLRRQWLCSDAAGNVTMQGANPPLATFDQFNIHASVPSTTIYTPLVTGLYKVNLYFTQDVACVTVGTGSINGGLTWTDENNTPTFSNWIPGGINWSVSLPFNSVLAAGGVNQFVIYALAGTPIKVQTAYVSCTSPANNNYDFHASVTY